MRVIDLQSIRLKLASPEEILAWSHGEITKPETINYRTQRAEKDGLFCEKIFGPERDYECYCGKYKRIRYKGIVCDRCGVEVTKSSVRRERMGHIKLASPCAHIWFLKGVPSRIGMVLDKSLQQLEKVIYFAAYLVTNVNEDAKKKVLEEIEREYKTKIKSQKSSFKNKKEKAKASEELEASRNKVREEILGLKPLRILSEVEYQELSLKYGEVFEAGTGSEVLRKTFEKTDLKAEVADLQQNLKTADNPLSRRKILRRIKFLKGMQRAGIRPEWMFMTALPVLPPDLRPIVQLDGGRYASSDLNDLYRRVINRNSRLKYLLEISAPDVIVRNEKRMLQEAVDALIDNGMRKGTVIQATTGGKRLLKSLADILKGKQGRFRQNLLGKRVDYSGRSVIVVGPDLKLDEVGIPKQMALELFKPFVIKKILEREMAFNVRGASRLIEEEGDEVWAILEEAVKDKFVLLNRAPTLHRLGIQAFKPILIGGKVIRIHPMVCKAFNADFDGDQMAVHLPLSDLAQQEAKERMMSTLNLFKPATGTPVLTLYQDIVLGCYWLTRIIEGAKGEGKIFGSKEEAIITQEFGQIDIKAKVKIRNPKSLPGRQAGEIQNTEFAETSVGRVLFNETLPQDFPFQNQLVKVKDLEKMVGEIIRKYDAQTVEATLDKIKKLGFEYATLAGITWGIDDLIVPPQKKEILEKAEQEVEAVESHFRKGLLSKEEKMQKVIEIWSKVKSEIEKLVPKTLPSQGPVFQFVDAGARGSWSQPVQMTGMKGLVINPVGQIIELPVKSSYKEGFGVLEYFISTQGASKGTADTALRTSTAGYLTRRLVDVAHEAVVFEEDCGDEIGLEVLRQDAEEIGQNFLFKIVGQVALEKIPNIVKQGEIIDWEKGQKIVDENVAKVVIRSPLSCKSVRGLCRQCYGWDLGTNKMVGIGEAVGIVAAQAIGEPGTQLTMRTFHTGGVAGGGDITFGLPRVQEIFEMRLPSGKAELAPFAARVEEVSSDRIIKLKSQEDKTKSKKKETFECEVPQNAAILVKEGELVSKGQPLFEGSQDLKELFQLVGKEAAQRYVIREIQKIYASQGAPIHDKHIGIIVRQMFSRVRIKEPGDSQFTPGEVIEKPNFLEENKRLKREKKEQAKAVQIILGISRVALTTDSFLSSASFQETSRVLIKAAIEGKEDKLRGLKENVIIGKLIPAGTGFPHEKKEK